MKKNRLSVEEAAALMGVSQQFVRVGMQQGILPWGYAVRVSGKRYSYFISPKKFTEHTGIDVPEQVKEENYEALKEAF